MKYSLKIVTITPKDPAQKLQDLSRVIKRLPCNDFHLQFLAFAIISILVKGGTWIFQIFLVKARQSIRPDHSSAGRAEDCRVLWLSLGRWFDSGWSEFFYHLLYYE